MHIVNIDGTIKVIGASGNKSKNHATIRVIAIVITKLAVPCAKAENMVELLTP